MNRRTALVLCALTAALTLTSCSTLSANNDVARVGEVSLDRSTFERYLRDVLAITNPEGDNSTTGGEQVRGAISTWVGEELVRQYFAEQGLLITDDDRAKAAADLEEALTSEGVTVSASTFDYIVESSALRTVLTANPDTDALRDFTDHTSVVIDSRYGYWDVESGTVVAFG